jgi:branched-chain amino acid transport system permease protein
VAGANIPYQNILIFVATIVVFVLLMLMLHRTPMGRQVRALANDREAALLQGIRVTRLSMLMFGLSAALAGLGGVLVAPRLTVTSEMGFALLLSSFAAVVLGGFDRVGPTVAAAMGIAIAQQMLAGYASFGGFESHKFIEAYPFIILLVVLVIRPYGFVKESTSVRY